MWCVRSAGRQFPQSTTAKEVGFAGSKGTGCEISCSLGQIALTGCALIACSQHSADIPARPVTALGLNITVPAGWTFDPGSTDPGAPLSFNNFASGYLQGGVRPSGGADVNITTIPLPTISTAKLIAQELMGATLVSQTPVTVGGETGIKVVYTADYGAFEDRTLAAYVPHGSVMYKFFLNHGSRDSNAASYDATFDALLAGASFSP